MRSSTTKVSSRMLFPRSVTRVITLTQAGCNVKKLDLHIKRVIYLVRRRRRKLRGVISSVPLSKNFDHSLTRFNISSTYVVVL